TKWKQKKSSGDFQSESKKTELQRKNEQFKAQYYKQQKDNPEDETLKSINNKISAGVDLTADEMKYLQTKNPMLYQKLKNDKQEEKAFEKKLKNCKTKDEVENLKLSSVNKAMSAMGAVKNNPNISDGVKLAVAESEMRKLRKLNEIVVKFVKSGDYAKLPTDEEVQKAQKDMAEARKAQTEKILTVENAAENKKSVGLAAEENGGMMADFSKTENTENEKASKNTFSDDKKLTVTEAENSAEAQKIKRSKAKKAYLEAENNFDFVSVSTKMNSDSFSNNIK
ncbi:MAG: hypothetical protein IJX24_05815, partial [Oscillospiraceae bacterium]|nr:hypothetical protein [Oscillospiraceae bacterium]